MTGTAVPPAAIAEAVAATRAYLRLADDAEPTVLATLAASAIGVAEAFCGVALLRRDFTETVGGNGAWHALSARPVTAIEATASGVEVDIDAGGTGWVRVRGGERAEVSYVAGQAADWAMLPAPLAQGVVALVAHLFAHRDDAALPPAAVAALLRPYRRLRLGAERRR